MDEVHTPASYFIAIFAVIGATLLLPPLPILLLISPLLLVLSALCMTLYTTARQKGWFQQNISRHSLPRARSC
jgi:hypothetical protein